jgi:RNA 2',3'-cyclic 3'-phosphodiesterase
MSSDRSITHRLFFALWPDPETRRALVQAANQGLDEVRGRRVAPENYHMTLAFLGTVTAERQWCFEQAAARVHSPLFTLILDRQAAWPRNGIAWIGTEPVPDPLHYLVSALAKVLARCGYALPRRPYHAHVTIGRHTSRIKPRELPRPITWAVSEFCLVASKTRAEGVHYEVLKRWPLPSVSGGG